MTSDPAGEPTEPDAPASRRRRGVLAVIGPGLLVAATGVGAGDLATASFTGSELGTAVLWAVVVGAAMKLVVTEGLARWQLATGQTLLEGTVARLGRGVGWAFLPYLLLWSFFVGGALVSACGVALHALVPVFESAQTGKVVFGIASSAVGLVLVLTGGYGLFERIMSACVGVMFVTVVVTAALVWPGTGEVVSGLVIPEIPTYGRTLATGTIIAGGVHFPWAAPVANGVGWTIALIGGVGGTVTVLCYGYWIREEGRDHPDDLRTCRLDLAVGYATTAVFGIAMVVIGSTVVVGGRGAKLIVTLAERLEDSTGPTGRWVFLIGAFGAIFSSLLGVWQAVPYLFADLWRLLRPAPEDGEGEGEPGAHPTPKDVVDTRGAAYRGYLIAIATIPIAGLFVGFARVQKVYAIVGALFLPLLAIGLLLLNGRSAWVGARFRNRWPSVIALAATVAFFAWQGARSFLF